MSYSIAESTKYW